MRRLALALVVAALAGSALFVSGAPASGSSPCWSKVINDWYDNGRIDGSYPIICYREALQHLPSDVQAYADANDVISRALATAIAANAVKKHSGGPPPSTQPGSTTPVDTTVTPTTPATTTPTTTGKTETTPVPNTGSNPPPAVGQPNPDKASPFSNAIKRLGPNDANAIPLPLVILGLLALLLLAAGAAGVVARKLQERRGLATPSGSPPSDPPPAA